MEPSPGTVDLASLAPPLRALFAGQQAAVETLRAENAALTERNRRLEQCGGDGCAGRSRRRDVGGLSSPLFLTSFLY